MEEQIKLFNGYQVSSYGYIISKQNGTRLAFLASQSKGGNYAKCRLSVSPNKFKMFYVHRIVASLFLGDITGLQVDHIDGNILNNNVSNLRIVTATDNLNNRWNSRKQKYYQRVEMNAEYFKTRGR